MANLKDIKGNRFGMLEVIERAENKGNRVYWKCRCDCGTYKNVASCHLLGGKINNCGCLKKKEISQANTKHGKSKTRLFRIWYHMKERCYRSDDKRYKNYGKRGIKVCDEWKDDFSIFYNWAMSNGYRDDLTIDRINVNANYEPNNCRWATMTEQANNTTRNHYLTYNGEKHTIAEWSKITNIPKDTIKMRLKRNWTIEKTLTIKRSEKNVDKQNV